ncbi:hypothetical protein JBE38_21310 [Pseudomonas sp. ICBG1301]|uniref:hypothetical protein n=1 Tax=Pseudomonas sp. ICBG1301 TaxID=2795987 RepID=UPI00196327F1|nr:hypothetical protein [Pseudomonas sp. ICBG1301]MBM9488474.1 hypothetical protein [Pseudomonas sp. ICBG1301]
MAVTVGNQHSFTYPIVGSGDVKIININPTQSIPTISFSNASQPGSSVIINPPSGAVSAGLDLTNVVGQAPGSIMWMSHPNSYELTFSGAGWDLTVHNGAPGQVNVAAPYA